jgi:hypothetical protein
MIENKVIRHLYLVNLELDKVDPFVKTAIQDKFDSTIIHLSLEVFIRTDEEIFIWKIEQQDLCSSNMIHAKISKVKNY